MQIDAKTAIWLNIIYAVLTGITGPMLSAAGIPHSEQVMAWMALLAFPLNVVLHAYSSSAPGPMVKALVPIALLGALLMHGEAKAASAPNPAAPTSTIGNLISQGLVPKVIADLQTLDTVAGAVNPKSTQPAPFNTYLPEAHQCIQAAIPWLQALPSPSSVPSPTGDGGVFTTLGMAEIQADNVQAFLGTVNSTTLLPLKMGCAAWAQRIIATPLTLAGNISKDTIGFLTMFGH